MNAKNLAEALRSGSLTVLHAGLKLRDLQGALLDAAAACEEEGASDADLDLKRRQEITEHNVEHIGVIELTQLREHIGSLEAKIECLINDPWTPAPPPAPEERLFCAYCGERGHQWNGCPARISAGYPPAAASAAPYPMCATHTFVTTDKCGCAKRDAPPEQAQEDGDAKLGAWGSGAASRCICGPVTAKTGDGPHHKTFCPRFEHPPEQAQETWLCGEQERNFRCTRRKGHAGPHEDTLSKPPEKVRQWERRWTDALDVSNDLRERLAEAVRLLEKYHRHPDAERDECPVAAFLAKEKEKP